MSKQVSLRKWFYQEDRLNLTMHIGVWFRDHLTSVDMLHTKDCCDFDVYYCAPYAKDSNKDNSLMFGFEI